MASRERSTTALLDAVKRRVQLPPAVARALKGDFDKLLNPQRDAQQAAALTVASDPVLTTQQAADLVGVSRPFLVARIEAGDIALHQRVGNQRRVLKSSVLAWQQRERQRQRRALARLGDELGDEIFSN